LLSNEGTELKSVLMVDKKPRTQKAKVLWPNATIKSCQPPIQGELQIIHWLNNVPNKLDHYWWYLGESEFPTVCDNGISSQQTTECLK
jgi:hypothetical protein